MPRFVIDMPFKVTGTDIPNRTINFLIEDGVGNKFKGQIVEKQVGCEVNLEGDNIFHSNFDLNGTVNFIEKKANKVDNIDDFKYSLDY